MRNSLVLILLASVVCQGCSRERSQSSSPRSEGSNSPSASPDATGNGRHVYLSTADLAKELSEHCGKADAALSRAVKTSSTRVLDAKQLSAQLVEANASMATCMTMVHGVEEVAFGTGAEKDRQTK